MSKSTTKPATTAAAPTEGSTTTPPAIPSIKPGYMFTEDSEGIAGIDHARIRIAVEGGQFLAALLMQHGADVDCDGGERLTACPNWTAGIGAAISAVFDSISAAHSDLVGRQ